MPGVDAYRVSEREQHDRVPEQLPDLRVVHPGDGGEDGARGLREGESNQRAGRGLQGSGGGEWTAAPRREALGVFHGDEAPVAARKILFSSAPGIVGCI